MKDRPWEIKAKEKGQKNLETKSGINKKMQVAKNRQQLITTEVKINRGIVTKCSSTLKIICNIYGFS